MALISHYGKLFQLSYVARDLDDAVAYAQRKLGIDSFTMQDVELTARLGQRIRDLSLRMAVANTGSHQFEIIQPVSGAIEVYTDGVDYDGSVLAFHHIGLAVTGAFANWLKLEEEVHAAGDEFAVLCPPGFDPEPKACFGYVDTRPYYGHYTEYLWWAAEMAGNPVFPNLS